jgi:hypothetical protein
MRGQREILDEIAKLLVELRSMVTESAEVTSVDVSSEPVIELRNTNPPTADVTLHLWPSLTLDAIRRSALTDWERKKSILFAIPDPAHEGFSYLVGPVPAGCELKDFQNWWKCAVERLRELHGSTNQN